MLRNIFKRIANALFGRKEQQSVPASVDDARRRGIPFIYGGVINPRGHSNVDASRKRIAKRRRIAALARISRRVNRDNA